MTYVFCRVSSGRGCSLAYQEAEIKKFTNANNWNIKETIKHVGSAFADVPKPLQALVNLKRKKIVFYCVDRFSRNYLAGMELAKSILKNRNVLYFTVEKLEVSENEGQHWEQFLSHLKYAEMESRKISQRINDSRHFLESRGYFTGSVAPFGYKKIKLLDGHSKLVSDAASEKILQFINECKSPGTSIKRINKTLYECGGDTHSNPIILDEQSNKLKTDLRYENIAELLEEYKIDGRPWTTSKVSRIYKKKSIQNLTNEFNIKTNLINVNTRSETKTYGNRHQNRKRKLESTNMDLFYDQS